MQKSLNISKILSVLLLGASCLWAPSSFAQAFGPCLILEESVNRYKINTCDPRKIQDLIKVQVIVDTVISFQTMNDNKRIIRVIRGERGNKLGGSSLHTSEAPYKRTGNLITSVLTPALSPDCQLTEEIVQESGTKLVVKSKSIKGRTCHPATLNITQNEISSGKKTTYIKIPN